MLITWQVFHIVDSFAGKFSKLPGEGEQLSDLNGADRQPKLLVIVSLNS